MNTEELRRLAEQATPGPWWLKDRGPGHDFDNQHLVVADSKRSPGNDSAIARGHYDDAAYIAAANPAAILSLLDELDRLRDGYEAWAEAEQDAVRAEQRVAALEEGLRKLIRLSSKKVRGTGLAIQEARQLLQESVAPRG